MSKSLLLSFIDGLNAGKVGYFESLLLYTDKLVEAKTIRDTALLSSSSYNYSQESLLLHDE